MIKEAISFFKNRNFYLPPFGYWTKKDWLKHKGETQEIFYVRLGWDVTDFGFNDFPHVGRTIFTLRNGHSRITRYSKKYCQKIMYLQEEQKSPIHFHRNKMEDIINHGGGNILVQLWQADNMDKLSQKNLTVSLDGSRATVKSGKILRLTPGESICITPGTFHQFWAEISSGPVLSMEISSVNDDLHDNIWLNTATRFPQIEEDVPIEYFLCSDYQKIKNYKFEKCTT